MENYIVRIYDRDPNDAGRVTGMLESVEHRVRRPFHSLEALESLLKATRLTEAGHAGRSSESRKYGKPSLTLAK